MDPITLNMRPTTVLTLEPGERAPPAEYSIEVVRRRQQIEMMGVPDSDLHPLAGRYVVLFNVRARPELDGAKVKLVGVDWVTPAPNLGHACYIFQEGAPEDAEPERVEPESVHAWLSEDEIEACHCALPSLRAFEHYCRNAPAARTDVNFQGSHRELGGYTEPVGKPWYPELVTPPSIDHPSVPRFAQCTGCPECLFGTCYAHLHPAQKAHPQVVKWEATPDEFKNNVFETYPSPEQSPLHFTVGTAVMCLVDGPSSAVAWLPGVVVKCYYDEEPEWPEGFWVPYQVRLTRGPRAGELIFVPSDDMTTCRLAAWPGEAYGVPLGVARVCCSLFTMSVLVGVAGILVSFIFSKAPPA